MSGGGEGGARVMSSLAGKVVLITGGTDGIGLAAAKAVGTAGAKVVVASRKEKNVERAVATLRGMGITCHGIAAHAGKKEDIVRMVKETVGKFHELDHLFINHAVSPGLMNLVRKTRPELPVCTEEQWDKIMDTNVKSFWLIAKEALPHLKEGSSIVLNASLGAYYPGPPTPAYGISKTAVLGLMKSLAIELGSSGIRVNAVAPMVIKTRMAGYQTTGKLAEERAKIAMLKRLGEPREVGDVVRFLLSEEASYITGESFQISGGSTIGARL
eukprot:Hpha_TRINITY_DN26764_c0_g1::TRINITY_DN26764_c0_g1_i1::g.138919::m.138919/K11147/DHRS4; dehydrogenase/reductase SDR family member 4